MTHPSIQGLREVVRQEREAELARTGLPVAIEAAGWDAQAAYLTEHGVLLSGEGLVPPLGFVLYEALTGPPRSYRSLFFTNRDAALHVAAEQSATRRPDDPLAVAALVPVPQDGEG